jgi:hypothetical protein
MSPAGPAEVPVLANFCSRTPGTRSSRWQAAASTLVHLLASSERRLPAVREGRRKHWRGGPRKGDGGLRLFSGRLRALGVGVTRRWGSGTPTLQRVAERAVRVPRCCSTSEQWGCQHTAAGRIARPSLTPLKSACFRRSARWALPSGRWGELGVAAAADYFPFACRAVQTH